MDVLGDGLEGGGVAGVRRTMVGVLSSDNPDAPLLWEWVLSRSSPAERRLSALQPRRLACRRLGSSGRPAPRHPLQLAKGRNAVATTLRQGQASRVALRHEERDASWRVRGGRVKKRLTRRQPQERFVSELTG